MSTFGNYPKYLALVNGQLKFLPLREMQEAWDWPHAKVELRQYVLETGDNVREMTDEDRKLIQKGVAVRRDRG